MLFLLTQIVAGTALALSGFSPRDFASGGVQLGDVLAICAVEIVVLAVAWVLVRNEGGLDKLGLDVHGPRQARGWWQLAPVGLLVIGPSFLLALGDDNTPVIADMSGSVIAAFVLLALLIAVAEELWYRGLLLATLEPQRSPWFAVFGSAVLFGLPHLFSSDSLASPATALNAAAVTLAIAVPFACVRIASRALLPMIGWHTAIDVWAFLHTASVSAQGEPDIGEAAAALVIPSFVALGYLIWLRKRLDGRAHSTL